jgi:DNA-binding MarR family transcriptional regulator
MNDDTAEPPTSALERSPSHLLHRAQQWCAERFASLFGDNDLTLRQFAVLAAVADKADSSQTDLVRATGIDRSTLADMIKRMEDRDLLERTKSAKDGRAKSVRLTNKGRAKLAEARPSAEAADRALLEALPKARRRMFLETLEMLAVAADQAAESEAAERKRLKKSDKQTSKKQKDGKKAKESKKKAKRL